MATQHKCMQKKKIKYNKNMKYNKLLIYGYGPQAAKKYLLGTTLKK